MRYRNLKTGAIIDSPCSISGGDWVAEETTIAIEVEAKHVEVKVKEKIDKRLEKHTKTELFEMLEDRKIAYKPEQTKKELIALLEGD